MNHRLLSLLFVFFLATQVSQNAAWAQVKAAPPISGVKGKLQAVTTDSLDVVSPSGVVHVKIKQPLTVYGRVPSDMSHVKSTSFVGVTSAKQPDGTELAKQINIFPKELHGIGEGSNMIEGAPGASQSRMTNGSVSASAASGSRMTNGTVQKQGGGTTMVVRYQQGTQTISVPKDVVVTETVPIKEHLKPGDTVNVATEKQKDGTLATSKVYLIAASK